MRPEVLSPAGSMEGMRAAVQNGADAVYMGYGKFNARRNAKNFSPEEIREAIAYCRVRGVKTHITVNTLVSDREIPAALQDVETVYKSGADALIVQDLGLAALIRRQFPDIALHGSTQLSVHTLDGARFAGEMGMTRVVLARELSLEDIRYITEHCGIETEIFVHGALCMSYSGQCYMSAVIGRRSGNRGLCAQPCRLPYRDANSRSAYPLSLKDLSLASHLPEIAAAGVASLKIEGRMKRPEYTGLVTKVFADLTRENRRPTQAEQRTLERVFSRDGFTDGYAVGEKGRRMFGTKTEVPLEQVQGLYREIARTYETEETRKTPVTFSFTAKAGKPLVLTGTSGGADVSAQGPLPEKAERQATEEESVAKHLAKLGGTPFAADRLKIHLEPGLHIPAAAVNRLRRECTDALQRRLAAPEPRRINRMSCRLPKSGAQPFAGYTVSVRDASQIAREMTEAKAVYMPLAQIARNPEGTARLLEQGVPLEAALPRVYHDREQEDIVRQLKQAKEAGISGVLTANIGHIPLCRSLGFACAGDFGLNAFNSHTLAFLREQGLVRQTVSFELRFSQIRDLEDPVPREAVVYGYLPLMLTENCAIQKQAGRCICREAKSFLTDRKGKQFRLLPEYGCRNTLLNSLPLYVPPAGLPQHIQYARLQFTTENGETCRRIFAAYLQHETIPFPAGKTAGLYERGVE